MTRTLVLSAVILSAPQVGVGAAPSLLLDDVALVAHIKKTDYIFTTALGACREEKLTRATSERERTFEYTAICNSTAAKESECAEYHIRANGTVDSPTWATVRSLALSLRCRR